VPQPLFYIVTGKAQHLTLWHAPITWGHVDNPAGRVKFATIQDDRRKIVVRYGEG
jgi:hypothetical protein